MKAEHKDLTPIELSLLTWYEPANPLYKNPEHPTIKLAGKIGKLLDLYAKHKYKPGFDWENCKWCKEDKNWHNNNNNWCNMSKLRIGLNLPRSIIAYIPLVLDELGDIWYYLRILAWIHETEYTNEPFYYEDYFDLIKNMYHHADNVLNGGYHYSREFEIQYRLQQIYDRLIGLLENLDITLDQLTELNYQKLNSEPTNHGWKDAR